MRSILPILVDLLALASLVLLAVPAWHFNRYAQLSAKLADLRIRLGIAALDARHKQLLQKAEALRDEWRPWKARCLFFGTLAGALAALLALIDHAVSYLGLFKHP